MNAVFIALIFNFCAGIANDTSEETIYFGYRVEGECIPHLELTGDNKKHPQTLPESHSLLWEFLQGGAEVTIDDQTFVIMAFREA